MKLSEWKEDERAENVDPNLKKESEKLANLSSDQLMQRLFEEVRRQKEQGVFDFEALKSNIQATRAFVGEESYKNLMEIVERLK